MKVMIFGATGMVGQGVLKAALSAEDVSDVLVVGRTALGMTHPKLQERLVSDLFHLESEAEALSGYDACLFCLGTSSFRKTEAQYTLITYDLTMSVTKVLVALNPNMVFTYVSGQYTDSTEKGSSMWARVKGRTENALLRAGFKAVYCFRPNMIQPLDGIRSKTALYQIVYDVLRPILPWLQKTFPNRVLTTRDMGNTMLNAVRYGYPRAILEIADIAHLARDPHHA